METWTKMMDQVVNLKGCEHLASTSLTASTVLQLVHESWRTRSEVLIG